MSADTPTIKVPMLIFHGKRRVELTDWPIPDGPLGPDEIMGRSLVTLVSPGTELNGTFDADLTGPHAAGYSGVMEVQQVGADVRNFRPGDRAFTLASHCARQRAKARDAVLVPPGLAPEVAAFARLMGVSWTTLTTTRARPADRVVVYGLGIIGNLCAQLFAAAGYRVTGIDLDEHRCQLARAAGLNDVRKSIAPDDTDVRAKAALVVDCTGHEQAVVDACQVVRKGGEVVLIGAPWKQRSQATAFNITHAVFHRYVTLRSGWEWSLPTQEQDFAAGWLMANFASAISWLAEGRIRTDGLAKKVSPADAQAVYTELLALRFPALTAAFDWGTVS